MIVSLDEYRRTKAHLAPAVAAHEEHEPLCVNWTPSRIIPVERLVPAPPLPSPVLPSDASNDNLEVFHSLAYAFATQI